MSAQTPPQGWYPDPSGSPDQRYWDGATWTESTRPAAPPAASDLIELAGDSGDTEGSATDLSDVVAVARTAPRHRRLFIALAALALVAVAAVVTAAVILQSRPSRFESALAQCELEDEPGARVADDGRSLIIDAAGEDDTFGLDLADELCLLGAIGTPESTYTAMVQTTAMQGRQTASWEGLSASWTYHPDNGLDVIVESE